MIYRSRCGTKTTQIHAHYAPSVRVLEMVNGVFGGLEALGGEQRGEQLSATETDRQKRIPRDEPHQG